MHSKKNKGLKSRHEEGVEHTKIIVSINWQTLCLVSDDDHVMLPQRGGETNQAFFNSFSSSYSVSLSTKILKL